MAYGLLPRSDVFITSDMVALPLIDPRQSTTQPNITSCTSAKLTPRKGYTDSWYDEMSDILAARKLTAVANEPRPPAIPEVAAQLVGVPPNIIEAVHAAITHKWCGDPTGVLGISIWSRRCENISIWPQI